MNAEGQKLILLCDDEVLMRQVAGNMLTKAGYAVLFAADGDETDQIYRQNFPDVDLVVLDLSMPAESGLDVFRRLKAYDADVRVLFSSGFQNDKRLDTALKEGALGLLQKPYTLEKMLRIVGSHL